MRIVTMTMVAVAAAAVGGAWAQTPAPATSAAPATAEQDQAAIEARAGLAAALPDIDELEEDGAGPDRDRLVDGFLEGQVEGELLASDLIGQALHDTDGNEIGEVSDVLMDTGGILAVVVETAEGAEGAQATRPVAIPFGRLGRSTDDLTYRLMTDLERAAFADAPEFWSLQRATVMHDDQHLRGGESADQPDEVEGDAGDSGGTEEPEADEDTEADEEEASEG